MCQCLCLRMKQNIRNDQIGLLMLLQEEEGLAFFPFLKFSSTYPLGKIVEMSKY